MSAAAAAAPARIPVWRARFVLVLLVAAFAAVLARAAYLQGMKTEFLQEKGEARYSRVLEVPATRGRISDRHGEALAISTPVRSVWAIPGSVPVDASQMKRLSSLLELDPRELERRVTDTTRDFVYLKRQLAPEAAERVAALQMPGLYQHREYRRFYPGGEVMAHVVGFTGVEDSGQEGVELAFQPSLAGKAGSRRVIRDRLGRIVEDVESIREAQDGANLVLALDSKIQSLAFGALKAAVEAHRAKAGAIVVLDVRTGEVLALANLPTYNPNNRAALTGQQLRNRVLTDTFEPGSTMKPFTIALALETGLVTPKTVVQTAPGRLQIANYTIKDAHPGGAMSVQQVIQKSSNVGTAKIALNMPKHDVWEYYRRLGFGTQPALGFPGEAPGRVRDAKTWRPVEQATMAYGYGLSVSLMQLARAYTAFARDGEMASLSLVRRDGPAQATRVFSAETAAAMREMLELAVQPGGTAPRARTMGYRVAGKTGTAHKLEGGAYASSKYVASFAGFAPVSAPRIVVAVMIDEPSAGQYYGGAVAAPVFSQVVQGALRLLGVAPDAPMVPVPLPGEGEEAREST